MAKLKDIDIRKEFIKRNIDFFKKETVFVNEMGVNSKNIVDIAALDFEKNIFYGFEIKSEVDNLKRLQKQIATYSSFFNIVYIVAHEKHTESIMALLNSNTFTRNMGYIEVTSDLEFKELRKAKNMKPRFDMFIKNLDLEELTSLCEEKGQFQGWENKELLVGKVKRLVTMDEIYEHMHNKVDKYYIKHCDKCGSPLYYNKKDRNGQKHSYCFECGNKF